MTTKRDFSKLPAGFSTSLAKPDYPAICVFGPPGSGKTRFMATAGQWAAEPERDQLPGWLVLDRKTPRTVKALCAEMGLSLPAMNDTDFITQADAMRIAKLDSEADNFEIRKVFSAAMSRFTDAACALCDLDYIAPMCVESGTTIWDYVSFSHFGKKQGVGREKAWGPPKQDWTDLINLLARKPLLMSFQEKELYEGNERTGKMVALGPPHLGYTFTTIVRLRCDRKLTGKEPANNRFALDIVKSQENAAFDGMDDILVGNAITYQNLLDLIMPVE